MNKTFPGLTHENELSSQGITYIAGVDEVGRGPLAGPVVACAVILPAGLTINGVNDSKKLSEKKRETLAALITESALTIGIGFVDSAEIDRINILQATFKAMALAINRLSISPEAVLVDGIFKIPGIALPQKAIKGGDGISHSIAAASIVAKVTRDAYMKEYDAAYPEYGFASNKGYGTPLHISAIKEHGACAIHRSSFIKKWV